MAWELREKENESPQEEGASSLSLSATKQTFTFRKYDDDDGGDDDDDGSVVVCNE